MSAEFEFLHCPICQQESSVEMPPCPDGHGEDCPERLCNRCGFVLAIAPALPAAATPHKRVA